jgi:hypothetical protein
MLPREQAPTELAEHQQQQQQQHEMPSLLTMERLDDNDIWWQSNGNWRDPQIGISDLNVFFSPNIRLVYYFL